MDTTDVEPPPPPAAPTTAVPVRPRRRRIVWAAVSAVVVVGLSAVTARLFVWPDLPALPQRADVIVQLGGPGSRRAAALDLVRQGRAPLVAASVTSDEINLPWCQEGRLRDVPVVCFHAQPSSTRGEAQAIAAMAAHYGWHSVILVTTPDQAWRATVRVSRCFGGNVYVSTARLPWYWWPTQIVYQIGATAKAYTIETSC
jgi:uncharacterized SAM-binding protein YcdF (DUF218 family)